MKVLFVINDAPYGTEKAYNAFRLVMALQGNNPETEVSIFLGNNPETEVSIFLMSDAVGCALVNQSTPQGYYNIERMLKAVINKGAKVKACGSCIIARGMKELKLIDGVEVSGMAELSQWILESEKIMTF